MSPSPNPPLPANLIIDTHADTPQRLLEDESAQPWDFTTSPLGSGHLNLAAARAGNLAAEFFAIWVDPTQYPPTQYVPRSLALIDAVHEQVRRRPNDLAICLTPAEILASHAQNKFAILMGLEGGHSIVNSLAQLRTYHALGVRYMTLTWANSNDWAESSTDLRNPTQAPPIPPGLTSFGRSVIAEMNRLGMMIDVSHVSDQTLTDVLAVTRAPVLASHSCARALCNSPRNLTDDQLRDLAANGGAVMVNFYSAFVDENYRQALLALKPERTAAHDALAAHYAARNQPIPFHASNQDRPRLRRPHPPPTPRIVDRPLRPHHPRRRHRPRRHRHRLRRHLRPPRRHRLRRRPPQSHRRPRRPRPRPRRPPKDPLRQPPPRLRHHPIPG
jgi:membrane dipeptidase